MQWTLKDAFEVLHLLNYSINTNAFPMSWAIGQVTSVPKEGSLIGDGHQFPRRYNVKTVLENTLVLQLLFSILLRIVYSWAIQRHLIL